ncbi:MAG: hypothetical protein EOL87_07695 [Spartobacteria bacterium]|nr:hypothetical protein [Spartobacteria bacterium]
MEMIYKDRDTQAHEFISIGLQDGFSSTGKVTWTPPDICNADALTKYDDGRTDVSDLIHGIFKMETSEKMKISRLTQSTH